MCCWCTAPGPSSNSSVSRTWGADLRTYVSIKGVPRSGAILILILTIGTPSTRCFLVATFSLLVFSSSKENINAYLCNCRDSARLADSQIDTEITNEYGSACKRCHLQNAGSPLLFPIYLKPFIMESSPVFFPGENILLPWVISSIAIDQLYVRVHHTRTYNDDIAAACLSWQHKSYILRILLILHSHLGGERGFALRLFHCRFLPKHVDFLCSASTLEEIYALAQILGATCGAQLPSFSNFEGLFEYLGAIGAVAPASVEPCI